MENKPNVTSCSKQNIFKYLWVMPMGIPLLTVYTFVLCILMRHRKTDFANSFYKIAMAMGFCDIFSLVYVTFYEPLAQIVCGWPFGKLFDTIFSHLFVITMNCAIDLQLVLAINRFVAVVLYHRFTLFDEKWTKKLIVIAFITACVITGGAFGQLNYIVDRDTILPTSENQFFYIVPVILGVVNMLGVGLTLVVLYTISGVSLKKKKVDIVTNEEKIIFKQETKLLLQGFIIAIPCELNWLLAILQYYITLKINLFILFGGNPFIYLALNKDLYNRCKEALSSGLSNNLNTVGTLTMVRHGIDASKQLQQIRFKRNNHKATPNIHIIVSPADSDQPLSNTQAPLDGNLSQGTACGASPFGSLK